MRLRDELCLFMNVMYGFCVLCLGHRCAGVVDDASLSVSCMRHRRMYWRTKYLTLRSISADIGWRYRVISQTPKAVTRVSLHQNAKSQHFCFHETSQELLYPISFRYWMAITAPALPGVLQPRHISYRTKAARSITRLLVRPFHHHISLLQPRRVLSHPRPTPTET